mmetsp:Transcript_44696/g.107820  ORF Transcript_44696/g.107820 Transcript_44696/m.107820 type:complete len:168 (+) Transcript_44696:103-606(+)
MPSYGAVDTQPSPDAEANAEELPANRSFQEMDMRFLKDDKTSTGDRQRKLVSTLVPILIGLAVILLFAKVALGAIGPYQDPNYPTEYGSRRPVPTPSTKSSTATTTTETAPSSVPASTASSSSSSSTTTTSTTATKASCSENKVCEKLGLTGLCCPTGEGTMLGCCP